MWCPNDIKYKILIFFLLKLTSDSQSKIPYLSFVCVCLTVHVSVSQQNEINHNFVGVGYSCIKFTLNTIVFYIYTFHNFN